MDAPTAVLREGSNARFEIGFGLAEVTRLLRAHFDVRMRKLGLTTATWRALAYLSRQDGLTQAALAERLEISRVALGETVDRLEKSGHVERRADPADRRKWRVHLTPLSRELIPVMFATSDELQADCFRDLSEHELGLLQTSLERVRLRLAEMKIETPDEEAGS